MKKTTREALEGLKSLGLGLALLAGVSLVILAVIGALFTAPWLVVIPYAIVLAYLIGRDLRENR